MNWFKKLFNNKPTSASIAKERLQVIVAHQRTKQHEPEFLSKLQQEITQVLAKYIKIDKDQVQVDYQQQGDKAVLELNVMIPEQPTLVKEAKTA